MDQAGATLVGGAGLAIGSKTFAAMVIEQDFFFNGNVRASWIFGSPNELAALVATVIPWTWCLSAYAIEGAQKHPSLMKRLGCCLAILLECAAWIWLASTASRGGAVAALAAACFWAGLRFRRDRSISEIASLFGRVAVCAFGFWLFSFSARIGLQYAATDASIGNRFTLWRGACQLMTMRPWSGWGVGEAGEVFVQWLQPLDARQTYQTTVNSFLHFGVERGFAVFGVVVFLASAPVLAASVARLRSRPSFGILLLTGASSWAAWIIANIFSTLIFDGRLWVVPIIAILAVGISIVAASARRSIAGFTVGATACVVLAACTVVAVSGVTGSKEANGVKVNWEPAGGVVLQLSGSVPQATWVVVPDTAVLGRKYGHEIRRLVEEDSGASRWIVINPGLLTLPHIEAAGWVLLGDQALLAEQLPAEAQVAFVHPSGLPPTNWHGHGVVIAPGIDEDGSREQWAEWASMNGLAYAEVRGVGRDALAAWPYAYIPILRRLKETAGRK